MLKETEETIGFFVTFLSLVAFQFVGPDPLPPFGYVYGSGYLYYLEVVLVSSIKPISCSIS